jgi:hypothetical protein
VLAVPICLFLRRRDSPSHRNGGRYAALADHHRTINAAADDQKTVSAGGKDQKRSPKLSARQLQTRAKTLADYRWRFGKQWLADYLIPRSQNQRDSAPSESVSSNGVVAAEGAFIEFLPNYLGTLDLYIVKMDTRVNRACRWPVLIGHAFDCLDPVVADVAGSKFGQIEPRR